MRAPLGSRGALLGDLGVSLGAALGGRPRRSRIDMRGRGRWPSAGATLDLDFVNQQGYAYGQGSGRIRDLVTISGGAVGTVVGPSGLVVSANAPRFDFDPVTLACRGLLIEEQRTNLLVGSSDLNNASWVKTSATISANAIAAPDGTFSADKIVENADNNRHLVRQSAAKSAVSAPYTGSVYVKAAERGFVSVELSNSNESWGVTAIINLSTGASSSGIARAVNAGNGWWRIELTATTDASAVVQWWVHPAINASTGAYLGDGVSGIYVWGAQLEAGAFATSYIPTTTAAVTRTADAASMVGASFAAIWNGAEGTFAVECDFVAIPAVTGAAVSAYQGSGSRYAIGRSVGGGFADEINFYAQLAGVDQAWLRRAGVASVGPVARVASAYRQDDFAHCVNGGAVQADSSGFVVPSVTALYMGDLEGVSGKLNGRLRRLRYWPRRLSNAEMQELTR